MPMEHDSHGGRNEVIRENKGQDAGPVVDVVTYEAAYLQLERDKEDEEKMEGKQYRPTCHRCYCTLASLLPSWIQQSSHPAMKESMSSVPIPMA